MIDTRKFSEELKEEFKAKFPGYYDDSTLIEPIIAAASLIATMAVEKYDREKFR